MRRAFASLLAGSGLALTALADVTAAGGRAILRCHFEKPSAAIVIFGSVRVNGTETIRTAGTYSETINGHGGVVRSEPSR